MGFSIGSETVVNNNTELRKQSYLENNNLYAEKYRSLLNKYLFDYGYVSMERVIWYLQVTNNVDDLNTLPTEKWEDAYIKNIDQEEKQMYPTKDMCQRVNNLPFYNTGVNPYPPLYPANVTVPSAAALIEVPAGAAISRPVCPYDLILSLLPNLEVIIPDTGVTSK